MKANYTQLILRSLENNLSDSEKIIFGNWLKEKENTLKYENIKSIWDKSGKLSYPELEASLNVEEAYQNVKRRTGNIKQISPGKRKFPFLVAASFVLLAMACGYFALQLNSDSNFESFTAKENMEYTLPDESTVWLNKGTELSYHLDFKNQRDIKLDGKALFEVTHNPEKPFTIDADGMDVTVLGTKFIVSNEQKNTAYVHVINGKVKVQHTEKNVEPLHLTKDMTAERSKSNLKLTDNVYANQMFWATNTLQYKDTSLEKIFDDLESYFDKTIESNDVFKDCNFNGSFSGQNIQEILGTLEVIYNLKIDVDSSPDKISITGPSCN